MKRSRSPARWPLFALGVAALLHAAPGDLSAQQQRGSVQLRNGSDLALRYELVGIAPDDAFGSAMGFDFFSRDNEQDFLVGAPGAIPAASGPAHGMLLGFDPTTGSEVARIGGDALRLGRVRRFGESVGVLGHPTGGPRAWWAVGAPATVDSRHKGVVVVIGDQPLTERYRLRGARKALFGWKVFTLFSDVDDDGGTIRALDFVVTAPADGRAGRRKQRGSVSLYSVLTGERLWRTRGEGRFSRFGYAAVGTPDRNADGIRDIWVSAPGSGIEGVPAAIFLLSGRDGTVLRRFAAPDGAALFGYSLAQPGDLDDDGENDLMVGAPATPLGATSEVGRVYVLSGVDGRVLLELSGEDRDQWFGATLSGSITTLGTERRWFIASAPPTTVARPITRGRLEVLDTDALTLFSLTGDGAGQRFGAALGGFRDLDGDTYAEIPIAAPATDPTFIPR